LKYSELMRLLYITSDLFKSVIFAKVNFLIYRENIFLMLYTNFTYYLRQDSVSLKPAVNRVLIPAANPQTRICTLNKLSHKNSCLSFALAESFTSILNN